MVSKLLLLSPIGGLIALPKALADPRTTVALGGAAGALLGGPIGALKGTLAAGAVVTGVTLLTKSPRARKAASVVLSPLQAGKRGETLAAVIEDPQTTLQKVLQTGSKILPVAVGTVAAATGVELIRRGVIKARERRAEAVTALESIPKIAAPTLPPAPTPQITQALAPVEKPVEEKVPVMATPTPTTIKNTFKPEINISFKKSKRFINQQNLIKA